MDVINTRVPFIDFYDNDPVHPFVDISKRSHNGAMFYIRFKKNAKQIQFFYNSSTYTGSDWEYKWIGDLN